MSKYDKYSEEKAKAIVEHYLASEFFYKNFPAEHAYWFEMGFMNLWEQLSTHTQEWFLDEWVDDYECDQEIIETEE